MSVTFRKTPIITALAAALLTQFPSVSLAEPASQEIPPKESIMKLRKFNPDKGFTGPKEYFTGSVTVDEPFQSEDFDDYQGAMVHFKAGARTAWHTHPKGQTIYITSGEGRAQSEGQSVQILKPGDVVWFPANVRHWHGAAPNAAMSHLAIQAPDKKGDVVVWMEHVEDKDYLASPK